METEIRSRKSHRERYGPAMRAQGPYRPAGACPRVCSLMEGEGIELVKLPPRSPNLNAFAEHVIRSIKIECFGRMIFFHEKMVRRVLRKFDSHYHAERNHQSSRDRERVDRVGRPTARWTDPVSRTPGWSPAVLQPGSRMRPISTLDGSQVGWGVESPIRCDFRVR